MNKKGIAVLEVLGILWIIGFTVNVVTSVTKKKPKPTPVVIQVKADK